MTINITIMQAQASYRSKEGKKEVQKYKRCFWRYTEKCVCHLASISVSFQLKSAVKFCPSHYNLLPLDKHHIRNILFCIPDLTKNHTPARSTVCTYRVLLLLIIFVLQSAICSSIQMKQEQTPNAPQQQRSSIVLFL